MKKDVLAEKTKYQVKKHLRKVTCLMYKTQALGNCKKIPYHIAF